MLNIMKLMAKTNKQQDEPLTADLHMNLRKISELTGNSSDIVMRFLQGGGSSGRDLVIVYVEGLVDMQVIHNDIMKMIMIEGEKESASAGPVPEPLQVFKKKILAVGKVVEIDTVNSLLAALFTGNTIILVDGSNQGLSASTAELKQRGVEEPTSQTVIRGPKEGFTEDLGVNIALLRRKIRSHNIWVIDRTIGNVTQTKVAVVYLNGVANDQVVKEVFRRLDGIQTDSILESGYIEEFIQDETFTPFPTVVNTERPDAVAGAVLEGRIAVLVDGTPFVLIVPVKFFDFFQSSEDYYQRFDISTFLRMMRYGAFIVSMLFPSIYIAVTTFHQEMLPTTLLITLAAQREGVPFPAFFEAVIMEITFEVLREAGVRMPRVIGPAISIVGALVLGQAAVQAGLVSAAMVIVVAFTAISNFVVPSFNIAIAARLIRFGFMMLAASFGFFGIMSGLIAMVIHLASLRSFGIPYLAPLAPFVSSNLKDIFVRVPWWAMFTRPRLISKKNKVRQGTDQKPSPPKQKKKV